MTKTLSAVNLTASSDIAWMKAAVFSSAVATALLSAAMRASDSPEAMALASSAVSAWARPVTSSARQQSRMKEARR